MKEDVIEWIKQFYQSTEAGQTMFNQKGYDQQAIFWAFGMFLILLVGSMLLWVIARFILTKVLYTLVDRTRSKLDDHIVNNKVFRSLAHLAPLMFMEYFLSIAFYRYPDTKGSFSKLVSILIIFAVLITVNRLLNALRDYIKEQATYSDKPIQSYAQILRIIFTGVAIILMLSVFTSKSPIFFLTSLGAVSAILILVFKDTILGFVGSIQLSANDMIRIGDWVTMEKFGADGNVEEINVATVKVRNFDKTITTIPTYSFISDSFRNWRGMQESDGRRIKRSIFIEVDTVKFASDELINTLSKIRILKEFIHERQLEIEAYNMTNGFVGDDVINARKQTNIGLFRRYLEYYLKHNSNINNEMNLLVRQLDPTVNGIPLEVYCFTHTKEWNEFESIQADIFDHLFAIVPMFELDIFESPSGKDFRQKIIN
jgi:miniconductance mechanosensitive channel